MAQLPDSLLSNEEIMSKLALFSLPIVRVVDYFAGATNAMRCDVTYPTTSEEENTTASASAIYAHENLEPCVGECVVAFCAGLLSSSLSSEGKNNGVWFPEEAIESEEDVTNVLGKAGKGAHTLLVDGGSNLSDIITQEYVWGKNNHNSLTSITM